MRSPWTPAPPTLPPRASWERPATPARVTVSANEVTVNVSFDQPTSLLRIIGIGSVTVNGRGTARSVRGIDVEEAP